VEVSERGSLFNNAFNSFQKNPAVIPLFDLLFIALYLLGVIGGILLWNRTVTGINLSFVVQLLQIPKIVISGYIYRFFMLLSVQVGFNVIKSEIALEYGILTGYQWALGSLQPKELSGLTINLIALALSIYLSMVPYRKTTSADQYKKDVLKSWTG
jgi:hypothetical protein